MSVYRFESKSSAETIAIGNRIAGLLLAPKFLILRGELGTGKTTLVKGIAEALGAADPDEVTSPTFTLIHEYEGRQKIDGTEKEIELYHLDLYRIENERQLDTLGLDELASSAAIVLIEWGDRFPRLEKRSDGEILIEYGTGDTRTITLTLKDDKGNSMGSPSAVQGKHDR